ncbi:hypothetical protein QEZ54_01845 [Catellatospora sp. KI3]|uniref:hypothetical protein n=1 Tax=Catellatospora sp. KI3 TaxID=3041620 RepID=UPI0024831C93|nr:hypothetical protein [Catellatospora sp. KI3]MDI1459701.1 hypothetical protein [Catellatospora sp. KI3]
MNFDDPTELAWAIPTLLIPVALLAGLVLALVLRKRLGAAATTLLVLGCLLGVVQLGFTVWWSGWGYRMMVESFYESGDFENRITLLRIVSALVGASQLIWISLLLAGGIVGRKRPQPAQVDPALLVSRPGESEWTVPSV